MQLRLVIGVRARVGEFWGALVLCDDVEAFRHPWLARVFLNQRWCQIKAQLRLVIGVRVGIGSFWGALVACAEA